MKDLKFKQILKTAMIAALTFVVALIWRDVIMEFIGVFVPAGDELLFKFITAFIATIFVIMLMYIFLKTEQEAEYLVKKFKKTKKKKR
ncbi:MAG: DUF5654 family protein [archaeon]